MHRIKRDIQYYYKKNRFSNLLKDTKKLKDLWKSKEAMISALFSLLLITCLTMILFEITNGHINKSLTSSGISSLLESARPIILTVLGGFFSLLGFTISGLALLTGTIGTDVITKIREDNKIDHLISVIFNFYFCGVIIGTTAIFSLVTYMITFIPISFNVYIFYFLGLVYSYLVIFSIIYSVMLLGTCIRLFLLKYFYSTKENNES